MECISAMKMLKKVSLCSRITDDEPCIHHSAAPSVEELDIVFEAARHPVSSTRAQWLMDKIMTGLFRMFVGLRTLKYEGRYSTRELTPDWNHIFGALFHQKTTYSLSHGPVAALESIEFNGMFRDNGIAALQSLQKHVHERYCDLKHFAMEIGTWYEVKTLREEYDDLGYNAFVKESLIPFMESADGTLESMRFEYGKLLSRTNCGDILTTDLLLLSSLPKSLLSLELSPRTPCIRDFSDIGSKSFVNVLCALLVNKESHNLQQLILKRIKLSVEARNYLVFMFGYNNNLAVSNQNHCFFFKK